MARAIDGTWSKFVWNLSESESLARKFRDGKACLIDVRLAVEAQPTLTPPNEWVSVEERLPTIEKDYGGYGSVSVNVFNGKSVLPMDYESSVVRGKKVFRWKYPWNRIYDGEPITHWRPLPAPPKKEE